MPSINNIHPITYESEPASWTRREYPSPDGKRVLVLHDPYEWHMMATGWKLSLFEDGRDVTRKHPDLKRYVVRWPGTRARGISRKGFSCPIEYTPWKSDSSKILLNTWEEEPVFMYDVHARMKVPCEVQSAVPPYFAHWDPKGDHALVVFPDHAVVMNSNGGTVKVTEIPTDLAPTPYAYWLRDGGVFFIIQRDPQTKLTEIKFYDTDGEQIGVDRLDPGEILPYELEKYKNISRKGFNLKSGKGISSAGRLMDTWCDTRYDQNTGVLRLAVYRPTGEPFKDAMFDGQLSCEVEQEWVECEITA